ncbi:MAG: tetratricopeptide repeat protein [Chthoniobacterales bacterium]
MPEPASSPPAPVGDRTYTIALWCILAFAGVEILAALIHAGGRLRAQRAAARAAAPVNVHAQVTPAPRASAAPTAASAPPAPASSAALSASDRLLQEATALRERGDTANALARLQEASQRDARNASVLAELATIYESIQLFDRANETWQKIHEIGPSAGPLFELAENKLRTGAPAAAPPSASTDAAGKPIDAEGIPEGSVFGVAEVKVDPVPDPDADTNLRLSIAVRKRPGVSYEVGKLRINVFLYDMAEDGKVVLTDADTSSEWLSPTHDWSDTDTETLVVSYRRSKTHSVTSEAAISAAAAAITPGKGSARSRKRAEPSPQAAAQPEAARRRYLGYLIRVYYNDKLQTVRADPARLVNDAPAAAAP